MREIGKNSDASQSLLTIENFVETEADVSPLGTRRDLAQSGQREGEEPMKRPSAGPGEVRNFENEIQKIQKEQMEKWNQILLQLSDIKNNKGNAEEKLNQLVANLQRESSINKQTLRQKIQGQGSLEARDGGEMGGPGFGGDSKEG